MRTRELARRLAGLAFASVLLVSAGCFHSIVETGLEPGAVGYHENWQATWFVGLIPAKVDAAGYCGGPWARVETQQNFLNGLVTLFTLGIYAPHEVEVVCAERPAEGEPDEAPPSEEDADGS